MLPTTMDSLTGFFKGLARRAKRMRADLLVYVDERQQLSFCFKTHEYTRRLLMVGTVSRNGDYEIFEG